jgi:hypothetical protein
VAGGTDRPGPVRHQTGRGRRRRPLHRRGRPGDSGLYRRLEWSPPASGNPARPVERRQDRAELLLAVDQGLEAGRLATAHGGRHTPCPGLSQLADDLPLVGNGHPRGPADPALTVGSARAASAMTPTGGSRPSSGKIATKSPCHSSTSLVALTAAMAPAVATSAGSAPPSAGSSSVPAAPSGGSSSARSPSQRGRGRPAGWPGSTLVPPGAAPSVPAPPCGHDGCRQPPAWTCR